MRPLLAVILVVGGFLAGLGGAIAAADPEGRGGKVLGWCWALGALAVVAGAAIFVSWCRSP